MIENIMDYSDCRNILTKGQKQRVDNTFNNYRSELVSIANLRATGVIDSNETVGKPIAKFEIESNVLCEGSTINFQDISCTNPDSINYKWFFPSGVPSAAFTANPTVTYSKAGKFDVTLIISNRAGTDTMVKSQYITVMSKESATKAPLIEGFENESFPYENWATASPDNMNWERTTEFSNGGDACLTLKNYGTAKLGEQYVFSTPPLDLSTSKSYELNFDLAYARFSELSSERLEVYAVDACRKVNLLRFAGSANTIRTTDNVVTIPFKPTELEWKSFNIDMNIAKSLTSASIEFRFTSYGEQNIFLDNLSIGSWPLTIRSTELGNIKVWPNPAKNIINISGLATDANVQIDVLDLSGRLVLIENKTGSNQTTIDLKNLEKGVYLVKIQSENGVFSQRIIKD
jgi:PKD repeat protein